MNDPDPDARPDPPEPANLRFLRRLVTLLTATMIFGVLVVIGLLVTRLSSKALPLPEEVTLPAGARALAVTTTDDWYAVVTSDQRILIFDRLTGDLRQEIDVQNGQ